MGKVLVYLELTAKYVFTSAWAKSEVEVKLTKGECQRGRAAIKKSETTTEDQKASASELLMKEEELLKIEVKWQHVKKKKGKKAQI